MKLLIYLLEFTEFPKLEKVKLTRYGIMFFFLVIKTLNSWLLL